VTPRHLQPRESVRCKLAHRAGWSLTPRTASRAAPPCSSSRSSGPRAAFKSQNWGLLLVTGGNVLFAGGTNDRFFRAFDARTGELLWQQRTSSGVIGVPTTYEIDGVQYVAVLSGWGVDAEKEQAFLNPQLPTPAQVPQGEVLWVFALPKWRRLGAQNRSPRPSIPSRQRGAP
jgi:outer membrane protein assembly factor BamB